MHEDGSNNDEESFDREAAVSVQDAIADDEELISDNHKAENRALCEQLRQERKWHQIEIDAIRKACRVKIVYLKARMSANTMGHGQKKQRDILRFLFLFYFYFFAIVKESCFFSHYSYLLSDRETKLNVLDMFKRL